MYFLTINAFGFYDEVYYENFLANSKIYIVQIHLHKSHCQNVHYESKQNMISPNELFQDDQVGCFIGLFLMQQYRYESG